MTKKKKMPSNMYFPTKYVVLIVVSIYYDVSVSIFNKHPDDYICCSLY